MRLNLIRMEGLFFRMEAWWGRLTLGRVLTRYRGEQLVSHFRSIPQGPKHSEETPGCIRQMFTYLHMKFRRRRTCSRYLFLNEQRRGRQKVCAAPTPQQLPSTRTPRTHYKQNSYHTKQLRCMRKIHPTPLLQPLL